MKVSEGVVLQLGGWIIERYDCGFMLYHETDKKRKHVVYPHSLASTLSRLHENILLENRTEDYDGSIESFKKILVDTHREFESLLSPILWHEAVNKRDGEDL